VSSMQPRKALIIDDDDDVREILTVLLEWRGFEVDSMRDGIDAVRLGKTYDVILLDLRMPVFDGERLADYWELTTPATLDRVIILSGYSGYTRGRKLPTFATLDKPFDHMELLRLVEACAPLSVQNNECVRKTDA